MIELNSNQENKQIELPIRTEHNVRIVVYLNVDQISPSISFLAFGNSEILTETVQIRIQCRIFLCWGTEANPDSCIVAESQRNKQVALTNTRQDSQGF